MDNNTTKDLKNLSILIAISLAIGIYLIATTVVISKDGIMYIERSKELPIHFNELVKAVPPIGFDLLIAAFQKLYSSAVKTPDIASQVIPAQICVLTCRLLAIVPIYFLGRHFFNRKHVFMSLLILSFLPYPTQFGVDVLRDWPHILFLFTALLFLVKGIRQSSWIHMTFAGLICGLGYIIRPECAQVVLYGIAIFTWQFYRCLFKKTAFRQKHLYFFLLAGFLLIFIPYSLKRQTALPNNLKTFFSANQYSGHAETHYSNVGIFDGSITLAGTISENLHYYFVVPVAIGFYLRFFRKKKALCNENLPAALFAGLNCLMLLMLQSHWGYISRRHALPLCILLIFYLPSGLHAMGQFITKRLATKRLNLKQWMTVLAAAGILICLPKLLRPIGQDKRSYLKAATWIKSHTETDSHFITFDGRIPFYAERQHWTLYNPKRKPAAEPDYWIDVAQSGVLETEIPAGYILAKAFMEIETDKEIRIYRRVK